MGGETLAPTLSKRGPLKGSLKNKLCHWGSIPNLTPDILDTATIKRSFDQLVSHFLSLPAVTSKSSGVVGKWGSFSSMRLSSTASSIGTGVGSSSDLKRGSSTNAVIAGAPKPKKFFKSREAAAPIEDDMDFTDSSVSQVSNILSFEFSFS